MNYTFKCEKHGEFDIQESIKDTKSTHKCTHEGCKLMGQKVIYAPMFNCPRATGPRLKQINTNEDWITRQNRERWI